MVDSIGKMFPFSKSSGCQIGEKEHFYITYVDLSIIV